MQIKYNFLQINDWATDRDVTVIIYEIISIAKNANDKPSQTRKLNDKKYKTWNIKVEFLDFKNYLLSTNV